MDRSSNPSFPECPSDPIERTGAPSENQSHTIETGGDVSRSRSESDRADLALFLGLVSLFMCGPLGIVPWVMANSDLKSIRDGGMSDRRTGTLRVAKALGIGGTLIFILSLGVAVTMLYRGFDWTVGDTGLPELFRGPTPLPATKIVFTGEWIGHRGSFIRINADGTGDFRGRETRFQSGRVTIDERTVSIGTAETSKVWSIEQVPIMRNGTWTMKLNGEIFRRRERGLTVERKVSPVVQLERKRRS